MSIKKKFGIIFISIMLLANPIYSAEVCPQYVTIGDDLSLQICDAVLNGVHYKITLNYVPGANPNDPAGFYWKIDPASFKAYSTPPSDSNSLGMTFKLIPKGTFRMGESEEGHKVTLTKSFYMQTTEVTQYQWKAVMGNNPSQFSACGDSRPVDFVSWNDVQAFIVKMNQRGEGSYRLPTEAEWEYAARAGSETAFPTGGITNPGCTPVEPNLDPIGWYCGNNTVTYSGSYPGKGTHPVGQKQPNPWGLYDMQGNVWEWVQDCYGIYPSDAVTDPLNNPDNCSSRLTRGGGWNSTAYQCLSAYRNYYYSPNYKDYNTGFRLVWEP
jgi:formylglycine-generating enzyme required for sulfatase activity